MSFIRTFTGRNFHLFEPKPEDVHIEDIAHALSNICRYTGHTKEFYSVAQHSCIVSHILEREGLDPVVQLQGLLHDATEAYLSDMVRPLKHSPVGELYCALESKMELVIAHAFGLNELCPLPVKIADNRALTTEMRDLIGDPQDWGVDTALYVPLKDTIVCVPPKSARHEFLRRYELLTEKIAWRRSLP